MLAATLVQHNADINIRDNQGETLLHRAIKKEDSFSALFLLENNCDVTLTTRYVFYMQNEQFPSNYICQKKTNKQKSSIFYKISHILLSTSCRYSLTDSIILFSNSIHYYFILYVIWVSFRVSYLFFFCLFFRMENESPLHLIAGANNINDCVKIAQKLINKNVNINAQNRQGQ